MRDIKRTYMNFSSRYKILAILVPILALLTLGAAQIYPDLVIKGKPWYDNRAFKSFSNVLSTVGSTKSTILVTDNMTLSGNQTINANTVLKFQNGAVLKPATNGITLTINGTVDALPNQKIFGNTATNNWVRFSKPIMVYPKWWGAPNNGMDSDTAAVLAAYNSLPTATDVGVGTSGGVLYHPGGVLKANLTILKDNVVLLCPESGGQGGGYYGQEQGTYWIADDVDSPVIQIGDGSHAFVAGSIIKNCTFRGGIIGQTNTGKYGLYLYSAYYPIFEHITIDGFITENFWQKFSSGTSCNHCLIVADNENPSNTVRQDELSGAQPKFTHSWLFGSWCQDDNASKALYNAACSDGSFYLIKGANGISLDHSVGEIFRSNHGLLFDLNIGSPIEGTSGSYIESLDWTDGYKNYSQKTVIAAYNSQGNYPWGYMIKGPLSLLGAYKRQDGTIDNDAYTGAALINFGSVTNDLTDNTFRYTNCIAGLEDNDTIKCKAAIYKDGNKKLIIRNQAQGIEMQGQGTYVPSVRITGDNYSNPGALDVYNPHGVAAYFRTDNGTGSVGETGTACTSCVGQKGVSRRGFGLQGSTVTGFGASLFLSEDGNGTVLNLDSSASTSGKALAINGLLNFTDNAAALTGGLPVNYIYRSGDTLKITPPAGPPATTSIASVTAPADLSFWLIEHKDVLAVGSIYPFVCGVR